MSVALLQKLLKGEALTDVEKTALMTWNPDADRDSAAAAARKKAEAEAQAARSAAEQAASKLAELEAARLVDADKDKSESQRLAEQVAKLTQQFEAAQKDKQQLIRKGLVSETVRSTGIRWVPEVDGSIMSRALEAELAGVPDDQLGNAEVVNPILTTFKARNKAVIMSEQVGGSGTHPASPVVQGKQIDKQTPDERAADLRAMKQKR